MTWQERHIRAFRTHRGHSACVVPGCIGSQPLVTVQTYEQWRASSRPFRSQAIDIMPRQALNRWIEANLPGAMPNSAKLIWTGKPQKFNWRLRRWEQ